MKTNQFRLGNYVCDRNSFEMQVVSIFDDGVYLDFEGNEGDVWECREVDLKPIPLTEEWLLKFGFDNKTNPHNIRRWYKKGHIEVSLNIDKKIDYKDRRIEIDLQSVHQLQNLYFSLVGEDLTIK